MKKCKCGAMPKLYKYHHCYGGADYLTYAAISCTKCGRETKVELLQNVDQAWARKVGERWLS